MSVKNIVTVLKQHYPGKNIIQNPQENPTEIVCEIDPSSLHPDHSVAIVVIDQSRPHYHKKTTEIYEIIQGELIVTKNGKDFRLNKGDQLTILPNEIHWAKGNSAWAKITSRPGWTIEDHIFVDDNLIAVSTYNKIANIYTDKYFTDLTDISFINKFLSYLPKSARILDVGCGPGTFIKYLKEKGFDCDGIDLSSEMLKIAKQKVPDATFSRMDMRNLTFDDECFDGLLVAYSLIHIPTPELLNTLKGIYRVLKPKGYALFITQRGYPDQIVDEPFKPREKMFFNFFTKERLNNFLENTGFKKVFQEQRKSQNSDSMSNTIIYTIAKKNDGH